MRRCWGALSVVALAAALAAGAQGVRSGDKCTYSTNGSIYTVHIATAAGVQHFGFAFGAPGLTITNVGIPGQNGGFTTSGLPANTSGAWMSDAPLTGTVSATLTGNGSPAGPIVVVPSASAQ